MGKYSKRFPDNVDTVDGDLMAKLFIADELAEANRLKRIELHILIGDKSKQSYEHDEDQA